MLQSSNLLRTGEWYHLALTQSLQELRMYVNAQEVAKAPTGISGDTGMYVPFHVGGSGAARFDGWLDEIAIFSEALSAQRIREIYEARLREPCKP